MTLDHQTITREELYEAVWAEPVVKVAKTYGLSDVGLAKIAKKLHVPVPGRGYWAKGPMERKLLKEALPRARPNVPTSHSFSQAPKPVSLDEEPPRLPHLIEAGIVVPKIPTEVITGPVPAHLASFRDRILELGLAAAPARWKERLPAITVSPALVERSLQILRALHEACQCSGLEVEVLPPDPTARNRYGSESPQPSRTGLLILDTFVTFEIREHSYSVEVPPPPPPPSTAQRKRRWTPEPDPYPPPQQWRQEGLGTLELELMQPYARGHRTHWRDGKRKRVEDGLNEFIRIACTLADLERTQQLEEEVRKRAEEAARQRKEAEEARQRERTLQLYDLNSRLKECFQADCVREFSQKVRAAFEQGEGDPDPRIMEWLAWAEALATDLETHAVSTVHSPRVPPPPAPQPPWWDGNHQAEERLRQEVDCWQRRYIFDRR